MCGIIMYMISFTSEISFLMQKGGGGGGHYWAFEPFPGGSYLVLNSSATLHSTPSSVEIHDRPKYLLNQTHL